MVGSRSHGRAVSSRPQTRGHGSIPSKRGRDRELSAAIEQATGLPATTSTLALLEAFATCGARRIALVTPYTADIDGAIAAEYARHGVQVVGGARLGLRDNASFGAQGRDVVRSLVRDAFADAGHRAQAVAVVCTNLSAAPLVAELETELGIPVLDSVAATVWHTLDLARATTGTGW